MIEEKRQFLKEWEKRFSNQQTNNARIEKELKNIYYHVERVCEKTKHTIQERLDADEEFVKKMLE